jgi:hypothetical protein
MRTRRRRAIGLVVAAEVAALGLAVSLFLQSEDQTRFPRAVSVTSAGAPRAAAVPVRVYLPAVGVTKTAALRSHGGHAASTRTGTQPGVTGYRRISRSGR